ncbi:ZIP family metal transporter [Peribacillus asahii]|uniref:ZIP family metal transporter n=1 Tax=Peribacillus asahii TaxID=228899 RepID=UPI00380B2811
MFYIGVLGFVATAIGISIGGLLTMVLRRFQQGIATIYALCTGLILGLVFLEIVPESINLGGWTIFILGIVIGSLVFLLIHQTYSRVATITHNSSKDLFMHTGCLLALSISIHNFPMGIAFGSSQHTEISDSILQTLILHNIPEGIAMFTPLLLAGLGIYELLLFTCIVSLPVGIGAVLGSIVGMDSPALWAFIISLAVGIMIMVTLKEIFYEALRHSSMVYSLIISGVGALIIGMYLKTI